MIYVIYWSQTGNTAEMAKAVEEGILEAGGEAKMLAVGFWRRAAGRNRDGAVC